MRSWSDSDVVARVESAIGLSEEPFPVQDLEWASRKLFEKLSATRPLVLLFDDVHWAEPTFLELVEHIVANGEAPLLVVCSTRRELLERLPEWSTADGACRVVLEPLSPEDTSAVAEHLLGSAGLDDSVRARVVEAAEGNPLFVEQLLSMLIDEGLIRFEDGCWRATGEVDRVAVPPTIQALLASRLDRLTIDERAVIEPAAVIGQIFVRDAVAHLTLDSVGDAVSGHLVTLTDKQFVRPDTSRQAEEDAFRFHHILIRDTAYEGVLKRARATLHARFVEWADGINREGAVEYEEILGYHLEQAHRYLSELGPLDERGLRDRCRRGAQAVVRGTPRLRARRRAGCGEPVRTRRRRLAGGRSGPAGAASRVRRGAAPDRQVRRGGRHARGRDSIGEQAGAERRSERVSRPTTRAPACGRPRELAGGSRRDDRRGNGSVRGGGRQRRTGQGVAAARVDARHGVPLRQRRRGVGARSRARSRGR